MSHQSRSNFGGNVSFTPQAIVAPRTEAELLEILEEHAGARVRAVGSLHAWSSAAVTEGVSIDLQHLNQVHATRDTQGDDHSVRVGAGCTIRRLLREMNRQAELTLPSLGLIQSQTVAGATATGTHGSGKHSMSHYIRAARVAIFDPSTGKPTIRVCDSGVELEAVRCSIGCLGVVTELTLEARPQYRVREVFRVHENLDAVLAAESDYPIQQFYLVPWDWRYFGQHRVETTERQSLSAWLYRLYWIKVLDLGLHLVVRLLVQRVGRGVKPFFRNVASKFIARGWSVVDRADRQLTMNHDWFRHIEIELFVTGDRLHDAMGFVQDVLQATSGEPLGDRTWRALETLGMNEAARALSGRYTHHYPICVRKVLPDQTLLSMAAGGDQPWYAISLISYALPEQREAFMAVADLLAAAMGRLFDARPHWGKVCPSTAADVRRLYPRLDEFLTVKRALDPESRFGNEWTDGLFAKHQDS
jgi:FAD/FMN-containing dehydrogenase